MMEGPFTPYLDEPSQLSVHVMLNGEESELKFITEAEVHHSLRDATFHGLCSSQSLEQSDGDDGPADLYLIVYSCVDKASFQKAEEYIGRLHHNPLSRNKPMILVANKIDLARSRAVSVQDGRCLACTYGAKFIEVSVGINHNVDELLVGILTQIRLKGNCDDKIPHRHWYNNHGMLRASLKARQMITWIFGKEDSKFKNCENLHVV
ncbi:hypothetical protein GE061_003321 [Apolygus lucorum]|uniref:Uncharacterized protein n=1 Tax=Apolygus lucorum TaxID=248454 RepID=A0A8S9X380_APOLU|nr:hypothetical protein GE061_003321 [Apolygus lucorum]